MGEKMDRAAINFHEAAEVFCVETRAPAGYLLGQHAHDHDHLSFLASGTVDLKVNGETQRLTGPCMMTIKAGAAHEVFAVTPITWLCLWGSNFGMQEGALASVKLLENA